MNKFLIITTINGPNHILEHISKQAVKNDFQLIIVGDTKTPPGFKLDGALYLSIEDQDHLYSGFSGILPKAHYARKNIGYLYALQHQPDVIFETDDDNIPMDEFWHLPGSSKFVVTSEKSTWYNVYQHFHDSLVWPRGYPLELLKMKGQVSVLPVTGQRSGIFQGLADRNPDVDAIYRLTCTLPLSFLKKEPVSLDRHVWCPFNSQNTIFFPEAFPLLYLPGTCSFRMTDIWRSFIAQRCLWEINSNVTFLPASVFQERNEHDLLMDLEQEMPGYLHNDKIRNLLEDCKLEQGKTLKNLKTCYELLVDSGYFKKIELEILEQWISFF
jgi:hypothetical protein